ncbi:MAG: hypothetical protein IKO76_06620 [Butyrivibrio sp.]|nr:hypothetical protein [Butyrivibrio sp.]
MYDKFGEMNSAQEINTLAVNLRSEGDNSSIMELAKENGIDSGIAEYFISGEIDFLCDDLTAATGKLDIESKEVKAEELISDWCEYIKQRCLEDNNMAMAVRSKGKSFNACIAHILKWSFAHQRPVDKEILKAANVSAGKVTFGIPGMATVKRLITEYYMGG